MTNSDNAYRRMLEAQLKGKDLDCFLKEIPRETALPSLKIREEEKTLTEIIEGTQPTLKSQQTLNYGAET